MSVESKSNDRRAVWFAIKGPMLKPGKLKAVMSFMVFGKLPIMAS